METLEIPHASLRVTNNGHEIATHGYLAVTQHSAILFIDRFDGSSHVLRRLLQNNNGSYTGTCKWANPDDSLTMTEDTLKGMFTAPSSPASEISIDYENPQSYFLTDLNSGCVFYWGDWDIGHLSRLIV